MWIWINLLIILKKNPNFSIGYQKVLKKKKKKKKTLRNKSSIPSTLTLDNIFKKKASLIIASSINHSSIHPSIILTTLVIYIDFFNVINMLWKWPHTLMIYLFVCLFVLGQILHMFVLWLHNWPPIIGNTLLCTNSSPFYLHI